MRLPLEELGYEQGEFENTRLSKKREYADLDKLRRQFVKEFPASRIRSLEIDQYVLGRSVDGLPDRDNFCYWVEWRTARLGHITGATASKFGLYIDKKTQQYKHTKRFRGKEDAIETIRKDIVDLIRAGRSSDLEAIDRNPLSPMFKGKILFLYHPDKHLNIFAESQLALRVVDKRADLC